MRHCAEPKIMIFNQSRNRCFFGHMISYGIIQYDRKNSDGLDTEPSVGSRLKARNESIISENELNK